jgi:hypothetical protein
MATILPNSSWPLVDVQVDNTQGPPNLPGAARMSLQRRGLGIGQVATGRGRQYELAVCEAGTAQVTVLDPQEQLNPSNTGSVFNSGAQTILPYRCVQIPVMWPTAVGSGNIINSGVNTGYDPSFETTTGLWAPAGGTTTCVVSSAQHFSGTKSLLVTQSSAGVTRGVVNTFPTTPPITYTFSVYVYPTGGCSVTAQVADDGGVIHTSATASTQNTWTRLSITWNCVDTLEAVTVYGSVTATPTFYVDATQLEFGVAASAFTTSGPKLYPIYTGYVERWPQTWTDQGFRGVRPLECVDALAPLSRAAISQGYDLTITGDSPRFYLPLNNKTSSVQGALGGIKTESFVPYELPNSSNGSIQWTGDSVQDGTPAVSLTQKNPGNPVPVTGGVPNNRTVLEMIGSPLSLSTTGTTVEGWFKAISGTLGLFQLSQAFDLTSTTPAAGSILEITNYIGIVEQIAFSLYDQDTATLKLYTLDQVNPAVNRYADGAWHYYAITLTDLGGGTPGVTLTLDGVELAISSPFANAHNIGFNTVEFNGYTGLGSAQAQMSASRVAVYTRDIGSTTRAAHYQRGIGYIGELSGTRVARLLTQYWGGPKSVAAGYIQLAADFGYTTRSMLDVLQEICNTENGLVYADRTGVIVFEDRSGRYATQSSVATFGDGIGELPYENLEYDLDPTYVYSQANLGRPANQMYAPQMNATSQAAYGQRILTQQLQVNTDFDLGQAAIFYLQRYGTPKARIRKLTLNPLGNAGMWPVVLALEISQRVTVTRRVNGVTISGNYYVEQINHSININSSTPYWTIDLQLSPVFVPSAWVMGDSTYSVMGVTTVPIY